MLSQSKRKGLPILAMFVVWIGSQACVQAGMVITTVDMEAKQKISLFGGPGTTLVATGPVKFTFEVDSNGNTIAGGASRVDAMFTGVFGSEWAFLGLNGLSFDLFSLDVPSVPNSLTATNGNFVSARVNFGLNIYAAPGVVLANFYTKTPSLFESHVNSLTDFGGAVLQDPNRPNDFTELFVGKNLLGLDEDSVVGASFDRTVAPVPEPASVAMWGIGVVGAVIARRRRQATKLVA